VVARQSPSILREKKQSSENTADNLSLQGLFLRGFFREFRLGLLLAWIFAITEYACSSIRCILVNYPNFYSTLPQMGGCFSRSDEGIQTACFWGCSSNVCSSDRICERPLKHSAFPGVQLQVVLSRAVFWLEKPALCWAALPWSCCGPR
jgi:hypothetical protein